MKTTKQHRLNCQSVAEFNASHQVGTPVRFWMGAREGEGREGTTWTEAQILSGHTAVVYVRDSAGKNRGCVALTHVEPIGSEGVAR